MKNFFGKKITFAKFLAGVFILFILLFAGRFAYLVWQNQDASKQNITILTQNNFVSAGSGNLQLYVQSIDNEPIETAEVDLLLLDEDNNEIQELFSGELSGSIMSLDFILPDLKEGKYKIKTKVKSKYGKDELVKDINISQDAKIIISTDRPLYKPGQRMSFRVMALDKASLKPMQEDDVLVSVVDPNENKIFQKAYKTSKYGIISDDFAFSDELAYGYYTLRAENRGQVSEKSVEVKQFTLPKYEVSLVTDQDLTQTQTEIKGKVYAKYFFGKPLTNARTDINMLADNSKYSFMGYTDENGILDFMFSGFKANKSISISAVVTDENNNKAVAQIGGDILAEGILVELIPESRKLKPGFDNEILFISSRADGTPVKTTAFMTGERIREFATNEFGIAKFTYRPEGNTNSTFTLSVRDEQGNALKKTFTLQNDTAKNQVLLRTNKTLYTDEKQIELEILGSNDALTQIELIQNERIVYSTDVEIKEGKAEKVVMIPDNLFGTVEIRAIQASKREQNYGRQAEFDFSYDSKIIFVDKAKDLQIGVNLDKDTYLPGSEAKLSFTVSDQSGNPENSALGVKIVDEALLALQDDDTSLSKLLFLVDEKIREHASPINGLAWDKVLYDDTLMIKDNILQAMFQEVPRAPITLSKIEKFNTDNQRYYQNEKKRL